MIKNMEGNSKKIWVIAADMGYGHQRAALPFLDIAVKRNVITCNNYEGIPVADKLIWKELKAVYEFISRFKKVPVLGDLVFRILDKAQSIEPFYPKDKGVEPPGISLSSIYKLMEKRYWGKHLIEKLNKNPLPIISTFFTPAFMAEYWGYKGPIFLVVTDTDVARVWAPLEPKKTKIRYFVPTYRAVERLVGYGVPKKNITLTGFPLPEEFVDKEGIMRTKEDLRKRLSVLDPERVYITRYSDVVRRYLGSIPPIPQKPSCVTITFAIGGAGAQSDLAVEILESLAELIKSGMVKLQLVSGIHKKVTEYFQRSAKELGLSSCLGKNLHILSFDTKSQYFKEFYKILRNTDILWTKPSELSFYSALGIPILMSPTIGSQEMHNQAWLLRIGSGIKQLDPKFANEWVMDFLKQGLFAEAAMQGFVEIEKQGTKNIVDIVTSV